MTYPPTPGRGTPPQGQYPMSQPPSDQHSPDQPSPVPGGGNPVDGNPWAAPPSGPAPFPQATPPGAAPASGLQPYPGVEPHSGAPQYPVSQPYPGNQQYPGASQYPGTTHYPGAQPYPGGPQAPLPQQGFQPPTWDSPFTHMQTAKSTPHRGLIAGIAAGVVVILALGVVLVVALTSGSDTSTPAVATASPSATAPDNSDQGGEGTQDGQSGQTGDSTDAPANGTQAVAVRAAMQRYLDAYNSGNLDQMKAATCTGLREQIRAPEGRGTVILDGMSEVQVTGDVAQSLVETHVTDGTRASQTKTDKASFSNEQGTWYFCPNAQPSYTT